MLVLLLIAWFTASFVEATPFTHTGVIKPVRWPLHSTINIYIQEDPCKPPDRSALLKAGMERWVDEMKKRGIRINVNTEPPPPPEGTENLVRCTYEPAGSDKLHGYKGYGTCERDEGSNTLVGGDIRIQRGLPADGEMQKRFLRNLGQHELTHVLGLADDVNGLVTNHNQSNEWDNEEYNETDQKEISSLYPVDVNYNPGDPNDPNAFPDSDDYPSYLFSKAAGETEHSPLANEYHVNFEYDGPSNGHVALIIMDVSAAVIEQIVTPSGWVCLNPADPNHKDPNYPFYVDYCEDGAPEQAPFDPNLTAPLGFRALDEASTLSVTNPSLQITLYTDRATRKPIEVWAGGEIQMLEGPGWIGYLGIDDFESYTNNGDLGSIWYTNGNAQRYLETNSNLAHEGKQSMKIVYDNSTPPHYSEVHRTYYTPQDWTTGGVEAFEMRFEVNELEDANGMYVILEDDNYNSYKFTPGGDDYIYPWPACNIDLQDFNDVGVDLECITKITIGFGDGVHPGGSGTVYFDDIRLYPSRCFDKPGADLNDDCKVDFKDFAVLADGWLESRTMWP